MSNELASLVSEGISGESKRTVCMAGKFYTVRQPVTYVLGRMLKPLSMLDVSEDESILSATPKSVTQARYMNEAIAIAILDDVPMNPVNRFRLWRMKRRFAHATDDERLESFKDILSIINPGSFFIYARLAMGLVGGMANQSSKSSADAR
jgi:hypothetical protein